MSARITPFNRMNSTERPCITRLPSTRTLGESAVPREEPRSPGHPLGVAAPRRPRTRRPCARRRARPSTRKFSRCKPPPDTRCPWGRVASRASAPSWLLRCSSRPVGYGGGSSRLSCFRSTCRVRQREVAPASSQATRTRAPGRAQWTHDDPHRPRALRGC